MDFDFSRQNVDCNDGTVRQGDALPLSVTERVGSRLPLDAASVMLASDSSSVNASDLAERNSLSRTVNPASTGRCRINMVLAAEGERIAAGMGRPATCSGCHGSGRKDYGFGERSCDYCNGSGLHIDECRQELVDAIGDKLADTNDLDVGWTQFARAVVELLEERGADVTALARP